MPLMSIRAYARHRAELGLSGTTHQAVRKAIDRGRIVLVDGQVDSEQADRAWTENSSEVHLRDPARADESAPAPRPSTAKSRAPRAPPHADPVIESGSVPADMTLNDALRLEKYWKGKTAELKHRQLAGELVEAKDVGDRLANVFTLCRTKLLAVPTRVRQAVPQLSPKDVSLIEKLIREALEELAITTTTAGSDGETA